MYNQCTIYGQCVLRVVGGSRYASGWKTFWTESFISWLHVLNLKDIEFPITLTQIKKFENQNNISINVYCIEKKKELSILPIRLIEKKMDKHVNLLYV